MTKIISINFDFPWHLLNLCKLVIHTSSLNALLPLPPPLSSPRNPTWQPDQTVLYLKKSKFVRSDLDSDVTGNSHKERAPAGFLFPCFVHRAEQKTERWNKMRGFGGGKRGLWKRIGRNKRGRFSNKKATVCLANQERRTCVERDEEGQIKWGKTFGEAKSKDR